MGMEEQVAVQEKGNGCSSEPLLQCGTTLHTTHISKMNCWELYLGQDTSKLLKNVFI